MQFLPHPDTHTRAFTMENPNGGPGKGGKSNGGRKGSPALVPFPQGMTHTLAEIEGSGIIRHLWLTTPPGNPLHDRNLILRAYWDNAETPAIECPLSDFFGMAHGKRYPLTSALITVAEGRGLNCWFQMPFRTHAKITLQNDTGEDISHLFYGVDATVGDLWDSAHSAYFHAQFRRENPTRLREDYTILEKIEGRGRFLGCVLGVRTLEKHWWGEGEVKFYLDNDTDFPTLCGTGLEDYFGSAWGIGEFMSPFLGCPLYLEGENKGENGGSRISLYRFHLEDPIWFHTSLKVMVQQLGGAFIEADRERLTDGTLPLTTPLTDGQTFALFERQDDFSSVAYFYLDAPEVPSRSPFPSRETRSADL